MPLEIVLFKCGGPYYRTRDGRRAVVLEANVLVCNRSLCIWQGRVDGQWVEWNLDGTNCAGVSALDLLGKWELPC